MPRLLLIDDDPVMRRVVSRLVRSRYEVVSGESVADAQEILAEGRCDLMLLDFRLPDGTGLDVCEAARAQGQLAPALLMSGYDATSLGPEASKHGVGGFLAKPFSEADLIKSLDDVLARGPADAASHSAESPPTTISPQTAAMPPSPPEAKPDAVAKESRFRWPWHRPPQTPD